LCPTSSVSPGYVKGAREKDPNKGGGPPYNKIEGVPPAENTTFGDNREPPILYRAA